MNLTFRTPGMPVQEADITKLETQLGYTFQEDYRKFLLEVNGGYQPNLEVFDIENGEGAMLKELYSVNGEKWPRDLSHKIKFMADEIPNDLIPVGQDGCGNDICLGINKQNRGEIYFHYHDRGKENPDDKFEPVYFIAHNFTDFLKSLRMDPGKILHDEIELLGKNGGHADILNFISKGNSLEKTGKYDLTVIQQAARHGNLKLVRVCHEHGANLKGAAHLAALNGHETVVDYLLAHGVDVNERDKNGKTILSRTGFMHKELAEKLKKKGAIL